MVPGLADWLAPGAILLSAGLAWLYHRSISAKRATLDLIETTEMANEALADARLHFADLTSGDGQALLDLVNPTTSDSRRSAAKVSVHLNHCELIAVAILNGAMDERMYKDWRFTTYVRTWEQAHAYITAKRTKLDQPKLYTNFQEVAERWRSEANT